MGEVQVELTGGWGNSSRSFSWATEFFFPLPEAAVHIWQQDPGAPTICRDTRFYDLLSVRFMEMMYDQQFFILSSQEQERKRGSGPLRYRGTAVPRIGVSGSQPRAPSQRGTPAGWCCFAPFLKAQPVVNGGNNLSD